jgi:hypothetical protein
MTGLLKLAL